MPTETCKQVTIQADTWTNVTDTFEDSLITVRNVGGTPVSAYITKEDVDITDEYLEELGVDPLEIGGLIYEMSNEEEEKIWVKSIEEEGRLSIRIKGTVDPSEDITILATNLNNLTIQHTNHENNHNNPHEVTKEQVGLGHIPNSITNNPELNSASVLATSKAVHSVYENVEAHKAREDNPHKVTQEQVGLGQVPNFPKADKDTATDPDNDKVFMTPAMVYEAVSKWMGMATGLAAQSIVKCQVEQRQSGWSNTDCSSPTKILEKVSGRNYKVTSGLQVAYADKGLVRLSAESKQEFTLTIPENVNDDKIYYVYVTIDDDGNITEAQQTEFQPHEGMSRTETHGDFFDAAQVRMYDNEGHEVKRVYVGRVILNKKDGGAEGAIGNLISCPLGYEYIQPVTDKLELSSRVLVRNPFVNAVYTDAEVEKDGHWGPSYWNDQTGVMASPYPLNEQEECVVQCGMVGFLASGRESGSPFGASFETVTTAPRVRVRFTKKYR